MTESGYTEAFDIYTPAGFHIVSFKARRSCEVFISRIFSCSFSDIKIQVDVKNRLVNCSEQGIKYFLQIIVGSGMWPSFVRQMNEYLWKSDENYNEGILSFVVGEFPYDYFMAFDEKAQGCIEIHIKVMPKP